MSGSPRPKVHPLAIVAAILATGALLWAVFGAAGRWSWGRGWLWMGLFVLAQSALDLAMGKKNPEALRARGSFGAGTKRWDVAWLTGFALLIFAVPVVAGLDAERFGWAPLPPWAWIPGALVFGLGYALLGWSMVVNAHFEKTVRIQEDRGHRVIDTGPYARIRHPGYAGFAVVMLGSPAVLGSAWAFVAALATVGWLVLRTVLEDRTLRAELPGYADYASRVPARWIPGIW